MGPPPNPSISVIVKYFESLNHFKLQVFRWAITQSMENLRAFYELKMIVLYNYIVFKCILDLWQLDQGHQPSLGFFPRINWCRLLLGTDTFGTMTSYEPCHSGALSMRGLCRYLRFSDRVELPRPALSCLFHWFEPFFSFGIFSLSGVRSVSVLLNTGNLNKVEFHKNRKFK